MKELLDRLSQSHETPGDYTENDILMCGKCHTPKQIRVDKDPFTGAPCPQLVPVACQCEQRERDERNRAFQADQFQFRIEEMWGDGITSRDILRHSFADDDRARPEISDLCRRYVDHWEEMKAGNMGILFYGSVGTGKSFFASAIANALLERMIPVAATSFPRLLNILQGTRERQEVIDRLRLYKLLIIDDLGVERDSSYAAEQVYNVIDARAQSRLPLIVTTNLTMEELKNPETMQYRRIYDRVLELCGNVPIKMTGESRRKGNMEVKRAAAQRLLLGQEG